MQQTRIWSNRLGAISDSQFQAVADRLGLGRFLHAAPVTSGLFGQNVYVTTTAGEFVLRGAPHWVKGIDETDYRQEDRWQFTKEQFFVRQLHEHTQAPAPWPMLHDTGADLLGWPYLVMPRMPGQCFDERSILKALAPADRLEVAAALGTMLAEQQRLTSAFAGDFDHDTITLAPYPQGNTDWVIRETAMYARMADVNAALDAADRAAIDAAAARALAAGSAVQPSTAMRPVTFVHGDYKLNNLTVLRDDAGWRVSGIFDLHEAHFGDGALDLVRQTCAYLESEPPAASTFVSNYLRLLPPDPRLTELMPLFVLNDRLKLWEYFSRPGMNATWQQGTNFRTWAGRYVDGLQRLLEATSAQP